MKSFFLFALLTLAVSIACSGYKSAGSPATPGSTPPDQFSSQTTTPAPDTQEKTRCEIAFDEIPAFKGLKIGMSIDEVLAAFPGAREDAELRSQFSQPSGPYGTSGFVIMPAKYQNKEKFAGITQIAFSLLDGRISGFTLNYGGPEYPHVDKFVEKFVDGTNLPAADQWEAYPGLDTQMKTLTCKGFEIRVFASGKGGILNYILVKDLSADQTLKDRRKKARALASPTP